MQRGEDHERHPRDDQQQDDAHHGEPAPPPALDRGASSRMATGRPPPGCRRLRGRPCRAAGRARRRCRRLVVRPPRPAPGGPPLPPPPWGMGRASSGPWGRPLMRQVWGRGSAGKTPHGGSRRRRTTADSGDRTDPCDTTLSESHASQKSHPLRPILIHHEPPDRRRPGISVPRAARPRPGRPAPAGWRRRRRRRPLRGAPVADWATPPRPAADATTACLHPGGPDAGAPGRRPARGREPSARTASGCGCGCRCSRSCSAWGCCSW